MGLLESIFYMMWRGIAIGIIMSAPMGPVGILCIQRTLDKGRRTGLYTGVGAALSDLFYCILTGFGLSFIEEFLEKNQEIIQLVGSIVLIGFSVYLFKKNPARNLKKPVESVRESKGKAILGGFLFTFSNPLILFLVIGLFARFNFLMPEIRFYHYIIGFAFIFAGAMMWWWMVTFFVDKVRAHFNLRSMWLINRIIGVIILLFAVVGIITGIVSLTSPAGAQVAAHYNRCRGYGAFPGAAADGLAMENAADSPVYSLAALPALPDSRHTRNFSLKFKCADLHNAPGRKYRYVCSDGGSRSVESPPWGIAVQTSDGELISIDFRCSEEGSDGISTSTVMTVTALGDVSGHPVPLASASLESGVDLYEGENIFYLRREGDRWTLSGGNRGSDNILDFIYPGRPVEKAGFRVTPGGKAVFSDITLVSYPDLAAETPDARFADSGFMESLISSEDAVEGIWTLFDHSVDLSLLRLGGDYMLGIVNGGDGYDMIYLDGARTGRGEWRQGLRKGRLLNTPFGDVFNVEWRDAEGLEMSEGIKAQYDADTATITIHFPAQGSELRFRRVR